MLNSVQKHDSHVPTELIYCKLRKLKTTRENGIDRIDERSQLTEYKGNGKIKNTHKKRGKGEKSKDTGESCDIVVIEKRTTSNQNMIFHIIWKLSQKYTYGA